MKKVFFNFRKKFSGEKGTAALEFVLAVPAFILISLWGVIEVGSSLVVHQEITEVAREGARLLSRTPNLREGEYNSTSCNDNGPGTFVILSGSTELVPETSHQFTHLRICQLLELHGYDRNRISVSSRFTVGPSTDPYFNDNVLVDISARHRSPVFGTEFITLVIERTAPYLLKTDRVND